MENVNVTRSTVSNIDTLLKTLASIVDAGVTNNDIRILSVSLADSSLAGVMTPSNKIELSPVAAKRLFDYVMENIKYVPDIDGIETFQTPEVTLSNKFGDCDDMTSLLGAMYRSIGFTYALVTVQLPGFTDYNHVYGAVYTTEGWKYVDASDKDTGIFDNAPAPEDIAKRKVMIIGNAEPGDTFFKDGKTEISYYSGPGSSIIPSLMPLILISIAAGIIYLIEKRK